MSKLPGTTGPETVKAFQKAGFYVDRIRGSHHIMKKPNHRLALSIPCHGKTILGIGILKSLIKDAGLSEDDFIQLLD